MSKRPETGPMQFGSDWTGIFIRGDNAGGYALSLRELLDGTDTAMHRLVVEDLLRTLQGRDSEVVQRLPEWERVGAITDDEKKRLQRSFDERLHHLLLNVGFHLVGRDLGRDDNGLYHKVTAKIGDKIGVRTVYVPSNTHAWSDAMVGYIVEAFC